MGKNIYYIVFENLEQASIILDIESTAVLYANLKAQKLLHSTKKELQNSNLTKFFPKDKAEFYSSLFKKNLKNKKSATDKLSLVDGTGKKIEVKIISQKLFTANKKIVQLIFLDKKKDSLERKNNTTEYSVFKNLPDIYLKLFTNGEITDYLSKVPISQYFKSKKIIGKKFQDILLKDTLQKYDEALNKLNQKKGSVQFQYSIEIKNNKKYFEVRLTKRNGKEIAVIIRELNSDSEIDSITKEGVGISTVLINNLPGIAFRCLNDKNRTMKFVSKGSLKLTGFSSTDFIDNNKISFADIIHKDDKEFVYSRIQQALNKKISYQITYRIITNSKEVKNILEQGEGVFENKGSLKEIEGYITDISEVIFARTALEQSESKFRSLVEKSLMGVYIIQENKFVYVNPIFTEIFGYESAEEIYSLSVQDLVYSSDKEKVLGNIKKRIENEVRTLKYSFVGIKKDKSTFVVEVMGSRTLYNGQPAVIGTLIDISGRIRKEDELKESKERFKLLFETMLDGTVIISTHGTIIFANKAALNLVGISKSDNLYKRNIKEFVHHDYISLVENEIKSMFNKNDGSLTEYKIKTVDGVVKWVESLAAKFNYKGSPSILITLRDITERKRSEEELSLLNFALHSAANSIVITDREGNVVWANDAFTKLTGYQRDEIIGKSTRLLKSGLTDKRVYIDLWNTIMTSQVWQGELINRRKDGTIYNEEMTVTPVKIPSSDKVYYIAVKQNITERKIFEEELRTAKDRAEEMNNLKSNFLANMSHELRTPLVGILGFAEMLNEELNNDDDLKQMSDSILSSGKRLMETLNYILDLSKIESNKLDLSYKEIKLGDVLKDIIRSFQAVADKKRLYIRLFLEDDNYILKIDEQLLRGILNNLINNALKFTNKGGITVEVYRQPEFSKSSIAVSVKDTGIGIPSDKLQLIFEEFRQASEGLDRKYEGTGLGLTITKKFVEILNGKITVESIEGIGSTFTVTFPETKNNWMANQIKSTEEPEPNDTVITSDKKYNVLLVENDEASINVTDTFLKDFCIIEVAKEGTTALKKAQIKKYDAIIMDIDLGWGMNGLEVTQELRKMEEYKDTPIIAVTAYAMKGDREAFLSAGCTHYLAKPFDKKSILNLMQNVLALVRK